MPSTNRTRTTASPVVIIGQDIRENLMGGDRSDRQGNPGGRHGVHRHRRGQEGRQDAGPEPRQLRDACRSARGSRHTARTTASASGPRAMTWALPMEQAIDQARVILRARRHDRAGRERQLRHRNQRQLPVAVGEPERNIFHRDDRDCVDFADRRRHRDHEHHAGVGDGADAGDRNSQSAGRTAARRDAAVPDRVEHAWR